ncbi:MAG: M3 family metallopeptidase [Candidatus Eisenbacteria bacterium]
MLTPWTGPFGGVPAWTGVKVDEFSRAFEIAMNEQRAEIRAIAENPEPANFENTIAAMERAGKSQDRLGAYFGVHSSVLNTGAMPDVQRKLAPVFSAFADEITQNTKLFKRIETVYKAREKSGLTPEQQRLTWVRYTRSVRAGASLDAEKKTRLTALNQRLATLYNSFSQNVLEDETNHFTTIDDAKGLAGLPEDLRAAAARAAKARGQEGKWVIDNTRSSMEPFLTYGADRALRQKVWTTYFNRGDNGDSTDNNANVTEILKLRFERANLLGYASHAHWRLEPQMAGKPERAVELMESVWTPAVAQVKKDVAAMQAIADREGGKVTIEPWDYRYYAEKLRKEQYDLDFNEVKPYLQLDKLREGMFWAAGRLYGLQFKRLPGLAVYHPDVTVYEVTDSKGKHVGLWYFDPYARAGKRSGAWMSAYRGQNRLDAPVSTIVSNNSNFVKGAAGAPVLISWEDAETMFHEFGHALHGLSSDVKYPTLGGTSVARDFVEFPSQINEHWLPTPEVLNRFALHHQTGKPMPPELLEKIIRAKTFNEGFKTMEYLASAMIDMRLHLAGAGPIDPDRFEREELARLGLPREIVMRHRTPQFTHVFAGDGYSAGYYSYLWADALTADAWEAFEEGKGPWDTAVAKRFRDTILSKGNTMDQAEEFRAFRGRDVRTDALMRKRGFARP